MQLLTETAPAGTLPVDKDLGKVVCEGYADAFALIMNYMGIPNYYIVGSEGAKGGGHAWNAVSADGGKTYICRPYMG